MFKLNDFFDLKETEHAAIFDGIDHVWEVLSKIKEYLAQHLQPGLHNRCDGVAFISDDVFIGEGTSVEDGAMIKGPTIIGRNCQIRHNAYIRGQVIIGDDCLVGNASEVKNSFLFNGATIPHYNYVGDSILGVKAHLGAGVKISNLKSLPGNVMVEIDGKQVDTGLRKFGAIVGDKADIGCNAVLNPGSLIGRQAIIYPCTNWRGVLPANHIAKNKSPLEIIERKELS